MATEGIAPFWRGNLANVLRYFPTQALNFAFKDTIKALFATPKDASPTVKFATNIASGGFAGTLSLLFVYSLDFARTRLANDNKGKGGERQFNGLIDVYVKTLKSDGIQGIYRGFTISAVGIFIYRGMYFGMFDTLKPLLIGGKDSSVAASFLLGWAVTVTAGLMSYPIGKLVNAVFFFKSLTLTPLFRHNQEEDDDDLWWRRQVQGFHRLRYADLEERGLHEHDEGCWCQHPPWCCWCRCARWLRQVPGHVHRVENQPIRACCSRFVVFSISDRQPMATERDALVF